MDNRFAHLLGEIEKLVRQHVVLGDAEAIAVTLWIAHTHIVESFGITPYLSISSAEKASGKTLLLELLEPLVARPWLTGSVTAATLARKIDQQRPTLLLDESDATFKGDRQYAETLRGVLNTGFRASGTYSRCVGSGAAMEVADFSTFCPKAIAGIGRLPDTAESRSIPIRLKRKAPHEKVCRWRERTVREAAEPLRAALVLWAEENRDALGAFDLAPMEELPDRAADIWEPLLGIARVAGDQWFGRAQKAAVALSGRGAVEDDSNGGRLLADLKTVFESKDAERLFSDTIINALVAMEDAPWAEWWNGKPITKAGVARLLRPFGIRPTQIRIGAATRKGYARDDFEDAWLRYTVSPSGTETLETPQPPIESALEDERRDVPVVPARRGNITSRDTPNVSPVSGGERDRHSIISRPSLGSPEFLPWLFDRFERGLLTESEWHSADRAHRFASRGRS